MITEMYFADMPHMRRLIKKPKFLSRFYSPQEMKFLMSRNFPPYFIAEMFCAKIAFKKAMGMSFNGCDLREVSVLADYSGAHYISLSGECKNRFKLKNAKINVSCAHSKTLAMATVVFYE